MLKKIIKLGKQRLALARYELFREKHDLNYLFWECTLNCNFRCQHCGSNAGESCFEESIGTKEIKSAFLDISKNFDPKKIKVAVTGGEPLMRKDIFEVMKYAASIGFKQWGMVSNGYLFTEKLIQEAKDAGMTALDISIDGVGDVHDEFRNKKGAYNKAINAVKLFLEAGFLQSPSVSTTVNKKNISSLNILYEELRALGLRNWRLLPIDPIGRAEINRDLLLNKEQIRELLTYVKRKGNEQNDINIRLGCAHFFGNEFEGEVRDNYFYCGTGINIGSILHNGDIFVCPNVPRKKDLIQGNIKNDSFSDVWNNRFKIFRDKNRTSSEECKKCEHWDECLGGSYHTWDFEKKVQKICALKQLS